MTNWASATAGQNFSGWTAGTASPCNWTGVQCDIRGSVTSLCGPLLLASRENAYPGTADTCYCMLCHHA